MEVSRKTDLSRFNEMKQVLEWNKKFEKYEGKFRLNPYHLPDYNLNRTMVQISPEKVLPTGKVRDRTEDAFYTSYLNRTVRNSKLAPGRRFRSPQTSAQEVGWFNYPVVPREKPVPSGKAFHHKPKSQSFETYYAVEFIKNKGSNLYKRNGNV